MGFLQGRYGFDLLSAILLFLSSILDIWSFTIILSLILIFVVIYRAMSRDIYRRREEYTRFRVWANKYLGKLGLTIPDNIAVLNFDNISMHLGRLKYNLEQIRKYKTVICPGCKKKLKLPRGRGRVIITCRTCKTEFKAKV